jgi:hypothetical protein
MSDQEVHSLISHFISKYEVKYMKKPNVNRNRVKFLIANILKDHNKKYIEELIDFYVKRYLDPNLISFCYEYDEVIEHMNLERQHAVDRHQLMRNTEKRVQEFRERYGNAK